MKKKHTIKNTTTEKIVCATIKYKKKYNLCYNYVYGYSHLECLERFIDLNLPEAKRNMNKEKQGFWTTNGRFIERLEAKKIAIISGQVPYGYNKDVLCSEDILWYALPWSH